MTYDRTFQALSTARGTHLYQDPYIRPRWQQLLSTEWKLFRAFRVDVYLRWTGVLWPLIFAWMFGRYLAPGLAILCGVLWALAVFAVVFIHEMGHITAGRRLGVTSERITLHALGGLAHLDSPAPNPRGEILIALAGPVVHVPLWLLFFGAARITEAAMGATTLGVSLLDGLASVQISLLVFNLLPFYPFDGGRALRAALAMKMHPNRASLIVANVGFGGAVVLGIAGLLAVFGPFEFFFVNLWGGVLVWLAIENYQACRRLQMEARWSEGPYAHVEEWKRGVVDPIEQAMAESRRMTEESRAPRRQKRSAPAAASPKDDRAGLQRRVDELLDKINEVGMDGLSRAERKELEEASRRLNE